jgi:hypothetical protein
MKIDLNSEIQDKINHLKTTNILKNIENLTLREYVLLIQERLSYSSQLEKYLKKTINESNLQNHFELKNTLQENLKDEIGENNSEAHLIWRKRFLYALNIKENIPIKENIRNIETFNYHKLLGVIFYIEGTIPFEFSRLKVGREIHFPKLRYEEKEYFEDHIKHDAKEHYPLLIRAIKNINMNESEIKLFLEGMDYIHTIRIEFYKNTI